MFDDKSMPVYVVFEFILPNGRVTVIKTELHFLSGQNIKFIIDDLSVS